ncbi:MAG: hypothetical protein E7J02_15390, partial [Staphylococcus warneri]|nr:hypothetical protein [Staphylococcus warneri]
MLKFQDFKAYGSIRKTKIAGACGVIIALATLGIVFGSNNVSADEVKPTTPATTEVAKPTTETAKPEAKAEETVKSVESPNLDSAVEKAKSVGINVTEKEKVGYDTEAEAKEDE